MEVDLNYMLNPLEDKNIRKIRGKTLVDLITSDYKRPNPELEKFELEWAKHTLKRKELFSNENGIFDRKAYQKSELYKDREDLINKKRELLRAEKINYSIQKEFEKSFKKINISQYSIEKANYFIQKFKTLREDRGISQSYELGFYLLGDKTIIDDVILGKDQQVTPSYCQINGVRETTKEVKKSGKKILGWAHSHAHFNTFYSSIDDSTMEESLDIKGIYHKIGEHYKDEFFLKFFYGMVFNEAQDSPALRLITKIPQYKIDINNGKIEWKVNYLDLDFETTPSGVSNNGHMNNWLEEEISDDGRKLTDEEKATIDEKLLDIKLEIGHNRYKRLGDFELKKTSLETKVTTKKQDIGPIIKEPFQDSLESKVLELQETVNSLKQQFKTLQGKYNTLKTDYESLVPRVKKLETYKSAMQTYVSQSNSLSTVANILLGNVKGNYKWENRLDRLNTVTEIIGNENLTELIPIVKRNRYLKENHPDIFTEVIKVLEQKV